jgi:hypothetical protein
MLKSDQGGETNIIHKVKHFSLFEDVYTNCLSGYALVVDAHNLINHFPIIGQETITIGFRTPGFNDKFHELSFDVHAITERAKSDNDKSEIYKLDFVSKELRISESSMVSKSVSGRISDIVINLLKDSFEGVTATVLKTKGEYKFVIPSWKVFETIDWLAERSASDEFPNNTNYLFFQRKDGYLFIPLGALSKRKSVAYYEQSPAGIVTDDPRSSSNVFRKYYNIQDIKIINNFDRLSEQRLGMYSSNLIVHDSLKKSITKTHRMYINNFDDTDRTEAHPYLPIANRYSVNSNAVGFIRSRHSKMHDDYENTQDSENWLLKREATLGEYDTLKLEITVAGNSKLNAGDCIDIRIPSSEPLKSQDSDWYDKYLSGKYIITSIRHSIDILDSVKEYKCIIELSRCGISEKTPDKSTFMGSGKENSDKRFIR